MSKPAFHPRSVNGELMPLDVPYTPFIYEAGTEVHRFALHKSLSNLPEAHKQWEISEPVTGMHVRTVVGSFKGVPVSSRGMTTVRARQAARATLDEFLERVGSDKFNTTIAQAKEKFK